MKKIIWLKDFELGIPLIDQQHQQWVVIINRLADFYDRSLDSMAFQDTKHETEILETLFKDILDFGHMHFNTEETFFKKFHYENAKEHIAEHHSLILKTSGLRNKIGIKKQEAAIEAMDFISSWFVKHVLGSDRLYVPCFHEHGL